MPSELNWLEGMKIFILLQQPVSKLKLLSGMLYMLPSFYNHDCDPNTHIIWINNANAKLKALRDVDPDEELRICYIDASMDYDARQTLLHRGFGFICKCARCSYGD
ncbi:hypothetical protein Csa_017170 [Cucumis sativus]|nr:hypothetical protein Csa_017170 [Cucumis sativus]